MALEDMTSQRHRLLIRCPYIFWAFVTFAIKGTTVVVIDHLAGAEFGLGFVHGADFPLYICIILYGQVSNSVQVSNSYQASSMIGAL